MEMSENDPRLNRPDDTEGHGKFTPTDAETAEHDAAETVDAHRFLGDANADAAESDDVEGHVYVQEPGAPGTRGT